MSGREDHMEFIKNGGALLNEKIARAAENEGPGRTLTVTGNYEIEETVLIPPEFTLILEDCHLRMAEGTFCNLFRNTGAGRSDFGCPDRDIRILGRGRAILDGGNTTGYAKRIRAGTAVRTSP